MARYSPAAPLLLFLWIFCVGWTRTGFGQQFTQISNPLPCCWNSFAWGDYDNDGNLDLLVAGASPASKVFHNDGLGMFSDSGAVLPVLQSGFAMWVDFDNDGLLDIFLSGNTTNSVPITKLFRNIGGNSFVDVHANFPDNWSVSFACWGDVDNDGDLDLLVSGPVLLRNDGNGHFTDISPPCPFLYQGSGSLGDYDNDGKLDILVAGEDLAHATNLSKIFRNAGNDQFEEINSGLPGFKYSTSLWGDYDNDGRLDVLLSGYITATPRMVSRIFHNEANGTFTDTHFQLPTPNFAFPKWVDYDGDGYIDLFVPDDSAFRLYRNAEGLGFRDSNISLPSVAATVEWADYDNDDDLDLWLAPAIIERNDSTNSHPAPQPPTDLSQIVSGRSAHLSWAAPTNEARPGLSYNLRVGTSPGGVGIISPMSDPSTGFRRVPRMGNAEHNQAFPLEHLAPGTYYWSVQAVNSCFKGSVFADEQSFTVNPTPVNPVVLTDPATQVLKFSAVLNARVYPNGSDTALWFEFGTDTNYGGIVFAAIIPNTSSSTNVSILVSNLVQGTTYYYRAFVTNTLGTAYGSVRTFLTANSAPFFVSRIGDQVFLTSQLIVATNFTITDAESPADQLNLTAISSNTNFVRSEDIGFSGSGSNRTVTLTRQPNAPGSAKITLTVSDPQGASSSLTFTSRVEYFTLAATLGSGSFAAWGDYNNDGFLDVAKSAPTVYRNNAGQSFSNVFSQSFLDTSVSWADYDNDSDLDLLVTGSSQGLIRLYRNNGNGTFSTNTSSGLPAVFGGSAAWADFDNDGRLDLFLTGTTNADPSKIAGIFHNNGNQTFSNTLTQLPGASLATVACADFDNDGHMDFILVGSSDSLAPLTRLYRNQGDDSFVQVETGFPQIKRGAAAWGDYNNDGFVDLLISGDPVTRVYRNNGDGTFTDINAGLPSLSFSSVAWGDFDNDGYLDIVLAGFNGASGFTEVYLNQHDGTFAPVAANLPGMIEGSLAWGDFNNDGRLDILQSWDGPTKVFRNNTILSNSPPSAPENLAAIVMPHNNVILTWDPAFDNETTNSAGLCYNLRVGTNSGGQQLFCPQSDLTTGARRLPNFGNAAHTNRWFLRNLPRGTYFWSVQAIDPGLVGSQFAPEASFTITNDLDSASNHAPTADSQNRNLAEDTSIHITLSGSDPDGDPLTYSIVQPPKNGTLRGTPPDLVYTPKTNFFGQDQFTFRSRDGLFSSTNATVQLTITPVVDIPSLTLSIQGSPPYIFITIFGEPYQGLALQSSTNLIDWADVYKFTNSASATGYSLSGTNYPQMFFRARTIP